MQCPDPQPCISRCPAGNDVPQALWLASQGDFIGAAQVFAATSPLPEVCGRVCPNLCQHGCVMERRYGAISVGSWRHSWPTRRGGPACSHPRARNRPASGAAVVGSGPAGITVAEDLINRVTTSRSTRRGRWPAVC